MSDDCKQVTQFVNLRRGIDVRSEAVELTDDVALRIGYEFALMLSEKTGIPAASLTIAVGRDSRSSGKQIMDALIRGITAADCDVLDCGLCTSPALFMAAASNESKANGAVAVTGSHAEADCNGFKFILPEGYMTEVEVDLLLNRAALAEVPERLVTKVDLMGEYRSRLEKAVHIWLEDDALKPLLGMHVVVDAGNGAGGFYADFLEQLGAETTGSLNLEPDGSFPNGVLNPEDPEKLKALSEAVVKNEADLGVLFDPDCDRAAIVDASGRAICRNSLIALISAILLEKTPGATIVTDSVTSSGLARFITEWGGTHYRFKRGHRNVIGEAIRLNSESIDCPIAIETSGHAAFRENYFVDDGVYLVTRLICEAFDRKREGRTLGSLIDELCEPQESVELRLGLSGETPRETGRVIIDTVLENTLNDHSWTLAPDNREGVRITFNLDGGINNAWFLLRQSVHDPVLALNAESDIEGGVRRMMHELYEIIKDSENVDLTALKALAEK